MCINTIGVEVWLVPIKWKNVNVKCFIPLLQWSSLEIINPIFAETMLDT